MVKAAIAFNSKSYSLLAQWQQTIPIEYVDIVEQNKALEIEK